MVVSPHGCLGEDMPCIVALCETGCKLSDVFWRWIVFCVFSFRCFPRSCWLLLFRQLKLAISTLVDISYHLPLYCAHKSSACPNYNWRADVSHSTFWVDLGSWFLLSCCLFSFGMNWGVQNEAAKSPLNKQDVCTWFCCSTCNFYFLHSLVFWHLKYLSE